MKAHVRRCVALVLVDRTLAFRELDDRFRWDGPTRAVLGGVLVVGAALVVVVPGLTARLAPASLDALGVNPGDAAAPLAGILSTGLLVHALLSISGREVREAVWPFDAAILRTAGYSRADLVIARAALPVVRDVLLQMWLGLVVLVPLAGQGAADQGAALLALYGVAVLLSASVRALGVAVVMRRPTFSVRGAVLRAVVGLGFGLGAPHAVAVVVGDQPLTAVLQRAWVAAGEAVARASTTALVVGIMTSATILVAVVALTPRGDADVDVRPLEPVPWPRLTSARSVLVLLPLRRLLSSGGGDGAEGRQLAGWTAAGLAFVLGLHLSGVEPPTGAPPAMVGAAAAMAVTFAAYAAHHPTASLLTHRRARNVLYSADVPARRVTALILVSGLVTAAPTALAAAGTVAWLTGSAHVLVHSFGALAGAVTWHFVADATMVESRSSAEDRITQTLPQRFVTAGLFGIHMVVATGADEWLRTARGAPAVAIALLGALAVTLLVRPRPWTGE